MKTANGTYCCRTVYLIFTLSYCCEAKKRFTAFELQSLQFSSKIAALMAFIEKVLLILAYNGNRKFGAPLKVQTEYCHNYSRDLILQIIKVTVSKQPKG